MWNDMGHFERCDGLASQGISLVVLGIGGFLLARYRFAEIKLSGYHATTVVANEASTAKCGCPFRRASEVLRPSLQLLDG